MKRQEFINELVTECELEGGPYDPSTVLNSIEGFDSLTVLSIIAYVDEKFSKKIPADQIAKLKDFNSLINEIGTSYFEDV